MSNDLFNRESQSIDIRLPGRPLRLWILVADKSGAKVYIRLAHQISLIWNMVPEHHERPDILLNKEIGRTMNSTGGPVRHKLQPHLPRGRKRAVAFAHKIANFLKTEQRNKKFDQLLIAAPPKMLGDLRHALSASVRSCIIGEIHKDFMKLPFKELENELSRIIKI